MSNRAHRRPSTNAEPSERPRGLLARIFGFGRERDPGSAVPVGVVSSRAEAELMAGFLRNNGLRAAVSADDEGGLAPNLQLQRVRVLVPHAQQARAKKLLEENEPR